MRAEPCQRDTNGTRKVTRRLPGAEPPIPSAPAWGLIAAIGGIPLGMKMKVRVSWLNPTGPRISQQWSELQRSRFRASR